MGLYLKKKKTTKQNKLILKTDIRNTKQYENRMLTVWSVAVRRKARKDGEKNSKQHLKYQNESTYNKKIMNTLLHIIIFATLQLQLIQVFICWLNIPFYSDIILIVNRLQTSLDFLRSNMSPKYFKIPFFFINFEQQPMQKFTVFTWGNISRN